MPLEGNMAEKATTLLRLAHLFYLSPRGLTTKQIADRFECTPATVYNYIQALRDVPLTIEETKTEDEGNRLFKLKEIPGGWEPTMTVSSDALLPFFYLMNTGTGTTSRTFFEKLTKEALQFLQPFWEDSSAVIPSELCEAVGGIEEFIERARRLFIHRRKLGRVRIKDNGIFKTIVYAALKQKECDIRYESVSLGKTFALRIQPLRIVHYRDNLSVIVNDVTSRDGSLGMFRSLVINRIRRAKETEKSFYREIDFDITDLKTGKFGTMGISPDRSMISVHLWLSPDIAGTIGDYEWGFNWVKKKEGEKGTEVEFDAPDQEELISWILSLGSKATVIGPEELREAVCREAEKTLEAYRKK